MPVTPTYPGVYVEEISSGVRTITGVATSITAFIGRALRGPVNKATTINSFGDFERIFGGLWVDSTLGFAVRDFYINGGQQAIIVRLFHPTFADEAARLKALDDAKNEAQSAADAVAKAAGDAAAIANPPADVKNVLAAVVDAVKKTGSPGSVASYAASAVEKAATDAAAITNPAATPQNVATAASGAVATAVTTAANAAAPITIAALDVNGLNLVAAYAGSWGNYLRARVDHDISEDKAKDFGLTKDDLFNLSVRDTQTGLTEVFRNATVKDSPRRIDKLLENESHLVRTIGTFPSTSVPTAHTDPANNKSWFEDDNSSTKVDDSKKASDGDALTKAGDFTPANAETDKKGLYALEQADLFNLLCIPPYLNDDVDLSLIADAASYCEKRRAMLLVDSPSKWKDKETAKTEFMDTNSDKVGTRSKNAALFFPRLKQPNPLHDNQMEDFAPCGVVAGIFARTDTERGVWKAPAGLDATLKGVPQLTSAMTDNENGELNPLGINCLRAMPAAGRVIWGSRTLQGDDRLASEWKYIPVRRLALFIEESLYRGTQWVVFEPNDEPLWAQIRLNIGAFMHNLFRQGAFQGITPRDAYFVKCDKETTTQNDINLGIVNIVVGFAPLKPAEFVIIKLQQIAGQIQV